MKRLLVVLGLTILAAGCKTSAHARRRSALGPALQPIGKSALLLEFGGPPGKRPSKAPRGLLEQLASGDFIGSEAAARRALRETPDDRAALTTLAASLIQNGKFELATIYAERLGKLTGETATSLDLKATAAYLAQRGSREATLEAIETLRQAVKLEPAQVASRLDLGAIYLEIGRTSAAKEAFRAVINRCRECTSAYLALASVHALTAEPTKAVGVLRQLLGREPDHFEAQYTLAVVYKDGLRSKEKAKECLDDLLERAPASQNGLRSKAIALRKEL